MKLCSGGDFLFCVSVISAAGVDRRRAGTWCGDWTVVFQLIEELQSEKVKGCQGWSGAVISSVPAKFQHSEKEEKVASPRSASPLWLNVSSKGFFRVIRVFMLIGIKQTQKQSFLHHSLNFYHPVRWLIITATPTEHEGNLFYDHEQTSYEDT